MHKNKCYIIAKYISRVNDFIFVSINNDKHLVYIGNFKNLDKIINKLENSLYLNAICRIRYLYEPEYPIFNPKINKELHSHQCFLAKQNLIWLEAIKLTTLPDAKLYPIEEKSYFMLEDLHHKLYPYIEVVNKNLTPENHDYKITIHGKLKVGADYYLEAYKVLRVSSQNKASDGILYQKPENLPSAPRKFGGYTFH